MLKAKSVYLLIIMGIMLFPWQLICTAHPFGHDHHEHNGPSPCELRRQYSGDGPVFFPPMNCDHVSSQFEDFKTPQTEKVKPTIQTIAVAIAIIDLHILPEYETNFIQLPETRSNSDPPCRPIKDRGPPIPSLQKQV